MVSKVGKVMKEVFLETFGPQSAEKWVFFPKLGLALGLGLGLGLAFQGVGMPTFDEQDGVEIWECDE